MLGASMILSKIILGLDELETVKRAQMHCVPCVFNQIAAYGQGQHFSVFAPHRTSLQGPPIRRATRSSGQQCHCPLLLDFRGQSQR